MNNGGARILVIDDEPQIRKLLTVSLEAHGFTVETVPSGKEGIQAVISFKPDLIIVDLGLPDMEGREVIKVIREWSELPIIVLSVREQEKEKIEALDSGADDYITKPFGVGELLARIRVALRRTAATGSEPVITCGGLVIDFSLRRVMVEGNEVRLTPTEYEILKFMARNVGRVLTHRQLLKAVWGNVDYSDTHYIRVYVGQMRRKIEKDPARPRFPPRFPLTNCQGFL
jgi:two-component system KDP operon response regulator KdpE